MKYSKIYIVLIASFINLCIFGIYSGNIFANGSDQQKIAVFKSKPLLTLWGFSASETSAAGQFLLPLYGEGIENLYAIAEGDVANAPHRWILGTGMGYRRITNGKAIGGYVLIDHKKSPAKKGFWFANPGLEMLGEIWDLHLDGYLALGRQKTLSSVDWANSFGITDYHYFQGHSEFDRAAQMFEEIGSGVNLTFGRKIPKLESIRIYLGGYHFATKDFGTISGGEAKLVWNLGDHFALELSDRYDVKSHNKFLAGIRLSIGGSNYKEKKTFGIAARLNEPLDHDLSIIEPPILKNISIGNTTKTVHDNINFFRPLPSDHDSRQIGNGTYEDPYLGFTQDNYSAVLASKDRGEIDKFPVLYFSPGSYDFKAFTSRNIMNRFNLPSGWSMYGRSDDYLHPALNDERPTFNGGLDLAYAGDDGSYKTIIDSVHLVNEKGTLPPAEIISDAAKYSQALQVDQWNNAALYVKNAKNAVLRNVAIENRVTNMTENAYGIYAINSTIAFEKLNAANEGSNSITASGPGSISSLRGFSFGIYADDHSQINFKGGSNEVKAIRGTVKSNWTAGYGLSYGIYASNHSTINFSSGSNAIIGEGSSAGAEHSFVEGYGIYLIDDSQVNFNGGINKVAGEGAGISTGDSMNQGYGIYSTKNSSINFNGGINNIDAAGTSLAAGDSEACGISANYGSAINFNDGKNTIRVKGYSSGTESGYSYGHGFEAVFDSQVNFNGGDNRIIGSVTSETFGGEIFGMLVSDNSSLNFNGGKNYLQVTSYGSEYGTSYGIFISDNSILNFNGGKNSIDIRATGISSAYSFGVFGHNSSVINFNGGKNRISALASSQHQNYSDGIYANHKSTVNFAGGLNNIAVGAKSNENEAHYGIEIEEDSSLQINGQSVTDFNDILNYAAIYSTTGTGGYKILWADHHLPTPGDPDYLKW